MLFRPLLAIAFLGITTATTTTLSDKSIIVAQSSDDYAEAQLVMSPNPNSPGVSLADHARISSILEATRSLVDQARILIGNDATLPQGKDMLAKASGLFNEVKDIMAGINQGVAGVPEEEQQRLAAEKRYAGHDLVRAAEDEERALDVSRQVYETLITFPECVEQLLETCLSIINSEIGNLGLSTIETVIHPKRNENQEGYNKVVIITNMLADLVMGKDGNGYVEYPFLWNEKAAENAPVTPKRLGVEGKWACAGMSPDDCCQSIKDTAKNPDAKGKYIECHIFVPFGGVGNPRRSDRVIVNLSGDGRVHEPPVIT